MIDINKAIVTTVKTGKILFGTNSAIKSARTKKGKLIIIASNCPQDTRREIEYNCKLSTMPMIIYKGNRIDLGAVCGKPFKVTALTIRDLGDSNILKLVEAEDV